MDSMWRERVHRAIEAPGLTKHGQAIVWENVKSAILDEYEAHPERLLLKKLLKKVRFF